MKAIRFLSVLLGIVMMGATASGQVVDSFSDGNFTSNPTWTGDTASWEIVTDSDVAAGASNSNTLRLNHTISESGTQFLSTQRSGSWGAEQSWGFWLGRRNQAATNANHSIVWLWANEADLESGTVEGYRIRFGDNSGDDEIVLQKVAGDGVVTEIIKSTGAVPNTLTDIGFLVRVTRGPALIQNDVIWTLFTSILPTSHGEGAIATDIPSKANAPFPQGSATEVLGAVVNFNDGYFGFMAVHATSADARAGAEFDQLYFDTDSDSSLPVELSLFTATVNKLKVILRWITQSETNNLGFRIYRSDRPDGAYVRINPVMIRGAGTSGALHTYEFTDADIEAGTTYYYYVEDVAFDGSTSQSPIIQTQGVMTSAGKHVLPWGKLKRN